MDIFIKILVPFIAGMGAGIGTGFAGMSAAAAISPVLIAFLDVPAYEAVGIALASDVLASGVSAYTYGKKGNLDIKGGTVLMLCVLLFTAVGSFISSLVSSTAMGSFSVIMTMLLGARFIFKPVMTTKEAMNSVSGRTRVIKSAVFGSLIGFICGFIGAGGGMMMLLVLTTVLGYELKCAVGTSVFVMTFTALTGAASHFIIDGAPDLLILSVSVISTLIFARIAAKIANYASPKVLNRTVGAVLITLGAAVLAVEYIF